MQIFDVYDVNAVANVNDVAAVKQAKDNDVNDVANVNDVAAVKQGKDNDVNDVASVNYVAKVKQGKVNDVTGVNEGKDNDVADVNDVTDFNEGNDNDVADVNDFAGYPPPPPYRKYDANEDKGVTRARMIARMRAGGHPDVNDVADVNGGKDKFEDIMKQKHQRDNSGEWKQEVCGCLGKEPFGFGNCDVCLLGWCCGCWLVKKNAKNMGRGDYVLCCLLSMCVPCIPVFVMRSEARKRYGIDGSTVDDAICSLCCRSCVNCQTATQIREEGDNKDEIYFQTCNDFDPNGNDWRCCPCCHYVW